MTLENKLKIRGIVLCKCGGIIVSNTGKIIGDLKKGILKCWRCKHIYNFESVFNQRKENEVIIYKD